MRTLFVGLGVIALLVGGVWILQGSNVIMNSAMSGSSFWLGMGIVVALVGVGLVVLGARASGVKKPAEPRDQAET